MYRTRAGYVSVDNSNPEAGVIRNNPHFRPQNFSQVPPPKALNRGSGRGGRGGFRGSDRGSGSRGRGGHRGRGAATVNTE
jgi:5'-3' exoribonuclease 1